MSLADLEQPHLRGGALADLGPFVRPPFVLLPPTTLFPHPAIGHPELGLCAIVVFDAVAIQNVDTGRFYIAAKEIDPERMAAEAALDLAAAARAPFDRVTGITWLRNTVDPVQSPTVCAVPDPMALSMMAEELMFRRLTGSFEPIDGWLAGYAMAALGARSTPSQRLSRFYKLVDYCIGAAVQEKEIHFYGVDLGPGDLADPRFMLPALLVSAWEDWQMSFPSGRGQNQVGFEVHLAPDPSALLGYRVQQVVPAAGFIALGPLVSCIRRTEKDGVFRLEDVVLQFARYLRKHGYDATVVEDAGVRISSQQA